MLPFLLTFIFAALIKPQKFHSIDLSKFVMRYLTLRQKRDSDVTKKIGRHARLTFSLDHKEILNRC